ncbi:MAG: hypothetical protein OHK0039_30640 [Bacteroidia bacterium]
MEWYNDIKEKFSKRRIRNLDRSKDYTRDFVDLESARKIGVIINVDACSEADLELMRNYVLALKERKKEVLIIELSFNKKAESILSPLGDTIFINPTKLNWLDYPTPTIEQQIRKHELDILMDFDDSGRMTSKYLCSLARAKTRTGVFHEGFESCYELMIDSEEVNNKKATINEFDYFLNMIDNGNKVKA